MNINMFSDKNTATYLTIMIWNVFLGTLMCICFTVYCITGIIFPTLFILSFTLIITALPLYIIIYLHSAILSTLQRKNTALVQENLALSTNLRKEYLRYQDMIKSGVYTGLNAVIDKKFNDFVKNVTEYLETRADLGKDTSEDIPEQHRGPHYLGKPNFETLFSQSPTKNKERMENVTEYNTGISL